MKFRSLVGKKFGKLIVIARVSNVGHCKSKPQGYVAYKCKCQCGNEAIIIANYLKNGHTQSCGCVKFEVENLVGFKFGKLTVKKRTNNIFKSHNNPKGHTSFVCDCDCGSTNIAVRASFLKNGKTKSCGCIPFQYENLFGKIFGQLIVKERVANISKCESRPSGYVAYKCDCKCGTKNIIIMASHLKSGDTKSCGCIAFANENVLGQLLINKFNFEKRKSLKKINKEFPNLFVDYMIEQYIIIEYNGKQHYQPVKFPGMTQKEAELNFNKQILRDRKLEKFCKENGFKLIIIDGVKYQSKKLEQYIQNIILPKINKLVNNK